MITDIHMTGPLSYDQTLTGRQNEKNIITNIYLGGKIEHST